MKHIRWDMLALPLAGIALGLFLIFRPFSATAALNTLTLAVAGLALFIALLGQAQRRLGQLAPLWALGIERPRLILLSLGQLLGLALLTLALAMLIGRFLPIVFVLMLAGSFAAQKRTDTSTGTLPTHGVTFATLTVGVVVLVAALTFFPALCLGPISEALA